jgi:hypothetical protein
MQFYSSKQSKLSSVPTFVPNQFATINQAPKQKKLEKTHYDQSILSHDDELFFYFKKLQNVKPLSQKIISSFSDSPILKLEQIVPHGSNMNCQFQFYRHH